MPNGQVICYSFKQGNSEHLTLCVLKSVVERRTGIPKNMMKFLFKNKLVQTRDNLASLPSGANVHLGLGLLGGHNCDMCFATATMHCGSCNQFFCSECCERFHTHPKRISHTPSVVATNLSSSQCFSQSLSNDSDDDASFASNSDISLHDAMLVATLAEKFNLTSFKEFQKKIIDATLDGRDTMVVYPTGSGKSLCFQFPPVFQDKKAVVISPTISLMQDQVYNLQQKGIKSTYLGSAQLDKEAESNALDPSSDIRIIFVTPEWISKSDKMIKVQALASADKLSLLAIDEAHLVSEWADFRKAYRSLENLHSSFRNTPIMALTATATPEVEVEIKKLLRNPLVTKASINRSNISLSAIEVNVPPNGDYFHTLANYVADISCSEPTVVYTDFIADIGPIVSSLADLGIEAVGYYGEMDPRERQESYTQWKSGRVNIMVATKAFGMGIDKDNIRHVIRNGVPESLISWAQEFGRAGRDGQYSTATILYRKSDIRHADPWVWNNVGDHEKCRRILTDFSNSWRFVEAHVAGCCRRKLLIELFGETDPPTFDFTCCDVCNSSSGQRKQTFNDELKILVDALNQVGAKGEVKIAEWIRGSSVSWTNAYNKKALSYGNSRGHTLEQWRLFMRQCHVLGLVKYELKSMIKANGHYSVMGVYSPLDSSKRYIDADETLLLPCVNHSSKILDVSSQPSTSKSLDSCSSQNLDTPKRKRMGKGSNMLTTVRKMLSDQENWKSISNKCDYHFLGAFSQPTEQHLYYIPDCTSLHQAANPNHHYLWNDIQLSKGQGNKDRLIEVEIGATKEKVFYRSASCLGVKSCPEEGCDYVAPIREKRGCKKHTNQKLVRSDTCPVEYVYIFPEKYETDHRRWIGGIIRNQKEQSSNLHNHKLHGAFKICTFVQDKICNAIQSNLSLTATDISRGKGIGFIPSAVDSASSHLGRIAREVSKTKSAIGINNAEWSPCSFEDIADDIDQEDNSVCHDQQQEGQYKKYGRPYLVSAGVENGIKYAFAMTPLMSRMLAEADFLQTDITYNQNSQYPYLFNAAVFNEVTMEWMVIARVWLNNQSQQGYKLAFKKMFDACREKHSEFELGDSLKAIILDWSDAEINGLKEAIGDDLATSLIKGCKVHWMRSCQRLPHHKIKSRRNVSFYELQGKFNPLTVQLKQ